MSEANIDGTPPGNAALPASQEPNHFRRVMTIWIVLSVVVIILWNLLARFILPVAASDLDGMDNSTIILFTNLAIPVGLFVFVFLAYSMFAFRIKERATEDAIPLKPRPMLQVAWMGITGALCLFLLIWGLFGFYQDTVASVSSPLLVQVTGQQWAWTFYYPQYGVSSQGQVLELPVNRPVQFNVTSKDVLHGFAVRALGVRVDANPGQTTITSITTPTQIGQYSVACVELCGLYHSYMWSSVNVVSTSSFNSWITSQGGHT